MSNAGNRRGPWLAAVAILSGMVVCSPGRVSAQDFGGVLNLFGARSEPVRPTPQPQYYRPVPPSGYYYNVPSARARAVQRARAVERMAATERFEQAYRARRNARSEQPRSRYAALPKPESARADKDKLSGEKQGADKFNNKQFVDQKAINADPTAAILRDPTLRAGDIVVTADGPKVFTGSSGKQKATGMRHRLRDFADVKDSKIVDKKTRQLLLAMMAPVGALPAHEARRYLAKMRKIAPDDEIAPVVAAARPEVAPRVIVPWKTTATGLSKSALPAPDDAPGPASPTVKVSLPVTPKAPGEGASRPLAR